MPLPQHLGDVGLLRARDCALDHIGLHFAQDLQSLGGRKQCFRAMSSYPMFCQSFRAAILNEWTIGN